jgi:hypothetical protein
VERTGFDPHGIFRAERLCFAGEERTPLDVETCDQENAAYEANEQWLGWSMADQRGNDRESRVQVLCSRGPDVSAFAQRARMCDLVACLGYRARNGRG